MVHLKGLENLGHLRTQERWRQFLDGVIGEVAIHQVEIQINPILGQGMIGPKTLGDGQMGVF